MTLEKYLVIMLVEEKSIIEELLQIDNGIGKTNLTYNQLLEMMTSGKYDKLSVNDKCNFITDGEVDTVFNVLITSAPFVKKLHINRNFVAINKWLVEKTKQYYLDKQLELDLMLDIQKDYSDYTNDDSMYIIYGFSEFVDGCLDILYDKNTMLIRK